MPSHRSPSSIHGRLRRHPAFGREGDAWSSWCKAHKPADAINIVNKRSLYDCCRKQLSYRLLGNGPTLCAYDDMAAST